MDFLKDTVKKRQFYYCYSVFLINGILALSVGTLLPFIRDARGLDYAFCGMIVSLHSIGNLISSFTAGIVPVFAGRKKSILFFNAFMTISFLMLIFGNSLWMIAASFFFTGFARGATSNFCNTLINDLAPGKAWLINALHATFAVGAFVFPLFMAVMTAANTENWILGCYFLLAMGILSWILYYLMPIPDDKIEKKAGGESNFGFFREPLFYLCTLTMFFYLCAEQGVIGWMITYFKDTGLLNSSMSQITASMLWIMILVGRLLTAWGSTKIDKGRLLQVMGAGMLVFFIILLLSKSVIWLVFGIMGFGFSMAGVYPTTVSYAGGIIKRYDIAWSFILTIASLGAIIMPSIIGKIADAAGIAYGMSSVAVVILIDLIFIFVLVAYSHKKE